MIMGYIMGPTINPHWIFVDEKNPRFTKPKPMGFRWWPTGWTPFISTSWMDSFSPPRMKVKDETKNHLRFKVIPIPLKSKLAKIRFLRHFFAFYKSPCVSLSKSSNFFNVPRNPLFSHKKASLCQIKLSRRRPFLKHFGGERHQGFTSPRKEVKGNLQRCFWRTKFKGILAAPPKATPIRNKGLIRPY